MTETRVCAKCGASLRGKDPGRFCPACQLASIFEGDAPAGSMSGPALATSTRVRLARDFGDYEIVDEVGYGGMGVVFKAKQRTLNNRLVAIKFMHSRLLSSEEQVRRFRAEAE